MGGEPVLVTIGDISVTATTVYTPSGSCPLSEVTWDFSDLSSTSQGIPTWAIICAVVFFIFCFVGLLFLLAKENKLQGSVQVRVQGGGVQHTTTIPVTSLEQVADLNARVEYARSLVTSYPSQPSQPGQLPEAGTQQVVQQPAAPAQPTPTQAWQQDQPAQPPAAPWEQAQSGQPWQQTGSDQAAAQPWQPTPPDQSSGQSWQQTGSDQGAGQPWLQNPPDQAAGQPWLQNPADQDGPATQSWQQPGDDSQRGQTW